MRFSAPFSARCFLCQITSIDRGPNDGDPLALGQEEMRALGYRTVDALVDWLSNADVPPLRGATPSEMAARLAGPPPEAGEPFEEALRRLFDDVIPFGSRS